MAFSQITKQRIGRDQSVDRVSMSRPENHSSVFICMSADIFEKMGRPAAIEVFLGEGPDTGTVLLTPAPAGTANAYTCGRHGFSKQHRIGVSAKSLGLLGAFKSTAVHHEITEDGLVVRLPVLAVPERRAKRVIERITSVAA